MAKVDNLLPIGSVVKIKDADKSMMIIGILPQNGDERYDYMALFYPEGFLTPDQMFLFNQEDLVSVEYIGYMNIEYQTFRNNLRLALSEENS